MKHYDQAQWLQFLRAESDPRLRAEMQRHLDVPCRQCSAILEFLHKVEAAAGADAQVTVPEAATRLARSIFALNKPDEVRLKPGIAGRLVFDSFREPAMAGIRSDRHLARQTLYEAGDYSIDLRFEPDLDPIQVVMVGQIANRAAPELPPHSIPIVLVGGRQELGRTITNQFGEFQLVYRPKMPLRLLVLLDPGSLDHVELTFPSSSRDQLPKKARSRNPGNAARSRKAPPSSEKF